MDDIVSMLKKLSKSPDAGSDFWVNRAIELMNQAAKDLKLIGAENIRLTKTNDVLQHKLAVHNINMSDYEAAISRIKELENILNKAKKS